MGDATSLAVQAVSQSQENLFTQIGVAVLKEGLDLQKETAQMLLESFGLGGKIDVKA